MSRNIPVIDFSAYGLSITDTDSVDKNTLHDLAHSVNESFRNIGFCYIKNHGIPEELIQRVRKASKEFFDEDKTEKSKYSRTGDQHYGWDAMEKESLNPERPGDLKEAYNYFPWCNYEVLPETRDFQESFHNLFEQCTSLSLRIFDIMSQGLNLKDFDFLRKCHAFIGTEENLTALRSLLYPALPWETKPGQVRCGEHSDYGTLTLLFQDDIGGLEVRTRDGIYIPATPIPGTIVVNIGDLMQRWTADQLIATKHRVMIPAEDIKRKQSRQSMAFFVIPDDDVIIQCLDDSNKYNSVTTKDYICQKINATL